MSESQVFLPNSLFHDNQLYSKNNESNLYSERTESSNPNSTPLSSKYRSQLPFPYTQLDIFPARDRPNPRIQYILPLRHCKDGNQQKGQSPQFFKTLIDICVFLVFFVSSSISFISLIHSKQNTPELNVLKIISVSLL